MALQIRSHSDQCSEFRSDQCSDFRCRQRQEGTLKLWCLLILIPADRKLRRGSGWCLCEPTMEASGRTGRWELTIQGPETKAAPPKPHIYSCHSSGSRKRVENYTLCKNMQFMPKSDRTCIYDRFLCRNLEVLKYKSRVVHQIELKASQS